MSWKRIFKLARKVKAPIIITNDDGKKAQVILPFDAYEDLITENEFTWQGVDDLDDDWDSGTILESDDDLSDISGIEFNDDDEINEAELYHQYRKKRDKDFGYIPYEELEAMERESENGNRSKTAQPDEAAESAFEPLERRQTESDQEEPVNVETVGEAWVGSPVAGETVQNQISEQEQSSSKSSEEIATEDRFYFEPTDDEARNG
jgi:hypothetical protein